MERVTDMFVTLKLVLLSEVLVLDIEVLLNHRLVLPSGIRHCSRRTRCWYLHFKERQTVIKDRESDLVESNESYLIQEFQLDNILPDSRACTHVLVVVQLTEDAKMRLLTDATAMSLCCSQ